MHQQKLVSASKFLVESGRAKDNSQRRTKSLALSIDGSETTIRDQQPLHAGNIDFEGAWGLGDLVDYLNHYVFFWPGKQDGPSNYGIRHYYRYENAGSIMLRVKTSEILEVNKDTGPKFCKFNSGAPRCSAGRKSPRGPNTFVSANSAPYNAGEVVEVVFKETVRLPSNIEYSDYPNGTWQTNRV